MAPIPKLSIHEDFAREDDVPRPSERNFGITFAVVFALIGALQIYLGKTIGLAWFAGAAIFLTLGLFWPSPLRPLNMAWFRLALVLYKVVNPIAMALLYVISIIPVGFLMRLVGRDPLDRRFRDLTNSYWIDRANAARPESMRDQF